jgi:dihydrofolate reductase
MQLSLIVAMSENNAIGLNGTMPWHLPRDLKHFKATTMGKPIIMGRTTFESLPNVLPGRTNIILTHNTAYQAPGCVICYSKEQILDYCKDEAEIMIVGGAKVYELFLPEISTIYLTRVHINVQGDTYFPALELKTWDEESRSFYSKDDKNEFYCSFITLRK